MIVGSAQEKSAIDENGRSFEGVFVIEFFVVRKRAGAKCPGEFELGDIVFVDLFCGRIARASGIVAVGGPARIASGWFPLRGNHRRKKQEENREASEQARK